MKKTLVFAVTLLSVACTAPTTNREAATTTNANTTAEKPSTPLTESVAVAREKQIWDALGKKDYTGFANMLTDDSVYVAAEAVYDKAGTVKGVNGFEPADVTFADWKFVPIDKDAGIITYKLSFKGKMDDGPVTPQSLYATTAWVNRDGKWLAIYHHDVEMAKTPPPAPVKATPKAVATPSATTAAVPPSTNSDVVANEKAVWETFKTKNYDQFATFLAPEFVEVEPTGVTDKAVTVKAVQGFDLTKASLSDWKTLKFDDDATLVTYTVMIPGNKPDTERHATIWTNKGGKWLALFHHGTPVAPMPPPKPTATKTATK